MVVVLDVQPDDANVTEPDCFFTVTVKDADAVPLTLLEDGLT